MKTIKALLLGIACLTLHVQLYSQYNDIHVELYVHDGTEIGGPGVGHITYRLFVETVSASDEVLSVLGEDGTCTANVSTTTDFWNFVGAPFSGGLTGYDCIIFAGFTDGIEFDSYVTIGYSGSTQKGIPLADDSSGNIPVVNASSVITTAGYWTTDFNSGGNIELDGAFGGLWGTTSGSEVALPLGANNSVLIGNFTTSGDFSFDLNVAVAVNGISNVYENCDSSTGGLSQDFSNNYGCTDETACNYNPESEEDNGSCGFVNDPCDDLNQSTGDDTYQEDCSCLGQLLGCMDNTACNFDPTAELDDSSCEYIGDQCDDFNVATANDTFQTDCECFGQILGCTDILACNFNPTAELEDSSCYFIGDVCDDLSEGTENDTYQEDCTCQGEILGCTNVLACNFMSNASIDDGSCLVIGDSCDDGLNNTENDIVIDDCACSGIEVEIEDGDVLANIYVETYAHNGTEVGGPGAGFVTYRVFVQTQDSDDQVLSVFGEDETCSANVSTTSTFWNFEGVPFVGSITGKDNVWFPGFSDGIVYDSYVTIGYSSTNTSGVPLFENPDGNVALDDTSDNVVTAGDWIAEFGEGEDIELDGLFGGLWGVVQGASTSQPIGTSNSVLIGNFTTDGEFSFDLNLGIFDGATGITTFVTHCENFESGLSQNFGSQCTDETACNYNPEAIEDDGSCAFPSENCNDWDSFTINDSYNENCECIGDLLGCIDIAACNYNIEAAVDNGSCLYPGDGCPGTNNTEFNELCECMNVVSGFVFIDTDFNGVFGDDELPLPYQTVVIEELGIQQITNDQGAFNFVDIPEGEYQISVNYTGSWTSYTTPQTQSLVVPQSLNNNVNFGVSSDEVPPPSACADFYPSGAGVPCNDDLNFNICWRNMSPYPISGVVEVQMDDLMSLNYTSPTHDSIVGQSVFWSYEDLGSWVMRFDDIVMHTPDETHFGEYVTNTVIIHTWYEGELIPITERTVTREVTCAYDPNDITGIPEGYTEDHLVLPDTRMEYLIRFQNTGNAPAGQVMVVDTLDAEMDPSTFQLVANSHSVMTTIHPSGRVEFLFENINLPDSTENEPESHGLVSFKVDFRDDVSIGEEINSTAYIFFDNNPAVITNTTWHTIHECGGEADFEASATEMCRGETVTFAGTSSLVEEHTWNIDAAPAGTESAYSSEFTEAGDYIIQLVAENPLCNASTMQMLTVYDLPEAEITESGAILTSSEGDSYQWHLNGEAIDLATDETYEALDDGSYSVEVTNENGCSTLSSAVMIVNIKELTALKLELFPNPMEHNSTLTFDTTREKTIRLTDPQGKLIRTWNGITDQTVEIERGTLAAGKYYVTVEDEDKISTIALVVR